MTTSRFQRMIITAGIISLLFLYGMFWINFIHDPVERTGSDFISYFSIGRIAQTEGRAHVYDPLLQQSIEEQVVGFPLAPGQVLLNLHLPFLIPFLQTIVDSNYIASLYRWDLFILSIYVIGILILARKLKESELETIAIILVSLGALLFYPSFFSLLNGQDTSLVFLGLSIWAINLLSGHEIISGLGLSLVTARPHIAIFLGIPMFFRHRKVFWGFLIGSSVLALLSIGILGFEGTREFINVTLIGMNGQWFGLNQKYMFNFMGILLRTMPWLSLDSIHIIGWLAYFAGIVALSYILKKRDVKDGFLGLIVTTAVLVAPHLHFHDLTLLLIPIYELIWRNRDFQDGKKNFLIALPLIISFLLLLGNASPFLKFTIPYLVMFGLAAYPYYSKRPLTNATPHRS